MSQDEGAYNEITNNGEVDPTLPQTKNEPISENGVTPESTPASSLPQIPTTAILLKAAGQWTECGRVEVSNPTTTTTTTTTREEEYYSEDDNIEIDLESAEDMLQLEEKSHATNNAEAMLQLIEQSNTTNDAVQHTDVSIVDELVTPTPSCGEHFRDNILRLLDGKSMQVVGIACLVVVIIDGALFFFFLMGWQNLCRPRTDCDPRNDIYNYSVQVLNVLFTYQGLVSMPWRCTNFFHVIGVHCPRRRNDPGYDLYGLPTTDIWFHLSLKHRVYILTSLLLNCIFQFINQGTRIVFYSYDLQNEAPGIIWVNIFFPGAFLMAFIGGCLLLYFSHLKRLEFPGKFGPGPKELVEQLWTKHIRKKKQANAEGGDADQKNEGGDGGDQEPQPGLQYNHPDPTRTSTKWEATQLDRAEMRLFAL